MAITKLGAELMQFEKTGVSLGTLGMGALWTAFPAMGVASGQQSVGEALGETAGGFAGWELGNRLYDKFVPKVQAPVLNLKALPEGPWYKQMFSSQNISNLGTKAKSLFTSQGLKSMGRGIGGIAAGMVASGVAASIGGSALGAVLPFKRKQPTGQDYFG